MRREKIKPLTGIVDDADGVLDEEGESRAAFVLERGKFAQRVRHMIDSIDPRGDVLGLRLDRKNLFLGGFDTEVDALSKRLLTVGKQKIFAVAEAGAVDVLCVEFRGQPRKFVNDFDVRALKSVDVAHQIVGNARNGGGISERRAVNVGDVIIVEQCLWSDGRKCNHQSRRLFFFCAHSISSPIQRTKNIFSRLSAPMSASSSCRQHLSFIAGNFS